jgi:inner membrane protein
MDSLTQIAIGAATGEAVLGKKLGNKAVMWGAVAGTISDLDVIPGMLFDDPGRLLFHRGFSHSLVFVLIATPVFSWLFSRFYRDRNVSYREWATYFGLIFFFSIFIDAFTTYGTQLLWPLKYRFEFNTIFVVDPLFTLPLIISTVWLMFKKRNLPSRAVINKTGLAISAVYLMFTVVNKQMINRVFESSLADQNISYQNMITNPGPANQVLWKAVVETDDRFLTGYYSHFDEDKKIRFEVAPKNHHLLTPLENFPQVEKILRFTKGYYTVEKSGQGFLINDLRFGKIVNWQTGEGQYVFRYRVKVEKGKVIVEEAEKTFDISTDLLEQLWKRINGKKDFTQ